MRKLALSLVLLLGFIAPAGAAVPARAAPAGDEETAAAITALRRYPVLYALPGTSNKANVWLTNIRTLELTRKLDLIVVIPVGTYDAEGGGFYTDWVAGGQPQEHSCRSLYEHWLPRVG